MRPLSSLRDYPKSGGSSPSICCPARFQSNTRNGFVDAEAALKSHFKRPQVCPEIGRVERGGENQIRPVWSRRGDLRLRSKLALPGDLRHVHCLGLQPRCTWQGSVCRLASTLTSGASVE